MVSSRPTSSTSRGTKKTRRGGADCDTARIGFVGAGKLATAIITGLISQRGQVDPKRIYVSAPTTINTDSLKITYPGIHTSKRNIDIFGRFDCDIVFICCPPNVIRSLYKIGGSRPAALTTNFIPNMRHPVYIISLVFGFTVQQIKECLLNPENPGRYTAQFFRCVISHPIAYGVGHWWIDTEPDSERFPNLVREIFTRIALIEYVPESLLDTVCIIVGSGITFCYYFINAIADGAVKKGMPRKMAVKFAAKIASSTSQTILTTDINANQLKEDASSPSGGAIYGQMILDKSEVSSGICGAIEASYKRSQTLALTGKTENIE
ncbi:hypothetical protein BLA29_000776 [Euroglyphus maynei]|uniref:Pyrroline-5-carboxylate reductase 3 n=1 Tax=Euroglyphus maynei TaxID=6958 RepID=A0A1Y3B119_EURMA|nr:hypothetical protein BLA29_000776 [Euroglyphus maynei]